MAKFYTPAKLSENIRKTPEGYLLCLAVPIARTGWQDYGDNETPLKTKDGVVRVYRDAKEVFRPETIASFEGKSLTIKHPEDFVDPKNWKELTKGTIHNVRRGEEKDDDGEECLLADVLVTDEMAIGIVNNGLREVSCGYEAEYEQTGEGRGAQTNIVGNHLALVEEGRAGQTYAINDHKRKGSMANVLKDLKDKIVSLAKTVDEAAAKEEKKEAKDDKAKDMDKSEGMKVVDKEMMDELVKAVKDLSEKVDGMKGAKDDAEEKEEKSEDEEGEGAAEKADDEDKEEKSEDDADGSVLEERIKALEAAVAKLLESKDDDGEESEDDDLSGAEGGEGEEADKSQKKTGDSKNKKGTGFEKTKDSKSFDSFDNKTEEMTAEKMNELNAAHWARK